MSPGAVIPNGVELDAAARERVTRFVDALLGENEHLNLTGAKNADELYRVHVADSLVLVPHLRATGPRRGVDLGSGGGLPGLVLACALQDTHWLLIDSTRKKVEALTRMAAAIGLTNVAAAWGRVEQLAGDARYRAQFDVATARAVADLPTLIAYAAPFLHTGGAAWFFKTSDALKREFPKAGAAARACGVAWRATHEYTLPGEAPGRVLVCYERV